jgi:uncharacterized protein YjbJ (UPF0337 family)
MFLIKIPKESSMSVHANEKILEGNWDKVKGKIKKQWGKITDDDMTKINGSYDELVGLIKKLYGNNQNEVEAQVNKLINGFDMNNIKHIMTDSVEAIKVRTEDVAEYVKGNPMKSMFLAVAMGSLITILFKNNKH